METAFDLLSIHRKQALNCIPYEKLLVQYSLLLQGRKPDRIEMNTAQLAKKAFHRARPVSFHPHVSVRETRKEKEHDREPRRRFTASTVPSGSAALDRQVESTSPTSALFTTAQPRAFIVLRLARSSTSCSTAARSCRLTGVLFAYCIVSDPDIWTVFSVSIHPSRSSVVPRPSVRRQNT